jgi:hypothetical protein
LNVPSKTEARVGSAKPSCPVCTALVWASLPVAHWMNSHAASFLLDAEFIASDHVQRLVA